MSNPPAFNPLDKRNLGESVALALSRSQAVSLAELPSISGAGIYALYYSGDFPPYQVLANLNRPSPTVPIYVGKAVPEGSRKGVSPQASETSKKLRDRLRDHARSIRHTSMLQVTDFRCRFLVVEETWIGLCESLLIQSSTPLWNSVLDGFGRHGQGGNRKDGISAWHAFHGGRDIVAGIGVSKDVLENLNAEVASFMEKLRASAGK
jgi:hypothetical protein